MASAPASAPLPLRARRRLVSARASALFVDTLLVAYTLWCANYLVAYAAGSLERDGWLLGNVGFLGPRPWLLLLTPLLAVLWQTTGASIGQRAYRVTVVDAAGEPADFDRRAWRGVLAAGEAALVLLPVALAVLARQSAESAGWSLPVLLSVVLMLGSGAFGLGDPLGRGVVDRLAGTHTVTLRPNASAIHRPWWKRGASWALLVVLLLTFAVGFLLTRFRPLELVTNIDRTANMWSRLLSPDWSIAARVAEKMVETVFLALMASALALPFAFAL